MLGLQKRFPLFDISQFCMQLSGKSHQIFNLIGGLSSAHSPSVDVMNVDQGRPPCYFASPGIMLINPERLIVYLCVLRHNIYFLSELCKFRCNFI
jgi:hypothetical protein